VWGCEVVPRGESQERRGRWGGVAGRKRGALDMRAYLAFDLSIFSMLPLSPEVSTCWHQRQGCSRVPGWGLSFS
jgi:hypothetical protein